MDAEKNKVINMANLALIMSKDTLIKISKYSEHIILR